MACPTEQERSQNQQAGPLPKNLLKEERNGATAILVWTIRTVGFRLQ